MPLVSFAITKKGQHYPELDFLHLTVIDFGIGIPTSVRSLPQNLDKTADEALQWAFEPGNSTKQDSISRGAGLNLLQEFIVIKSWKPYNL